MKPFVIHYLDEHAQHRDCNVSAESEVDALGKFTAQFPKEAAFIRAVQEQVPINGSNNSHTYYYTTFQQDMDSVEAQFREAEERAQIRAREAEARIRMEWPVASTVSSLGEIIRGFGL